SAAPLPAGAASVDAFLAGGLDGSTADSAVALAGGDRHGGTLTAEEAEWERQVGTRGATACA
ncbi:MAG: hypothetical protein ACK4ZJ_19240, partial [Allorhizobium sp.]